MDEPGAFHAELALGGGVCQLVILRPSSQIRSVLQVCKVIRLGELRSVGARVLRVHVFSPVLDVLVQSSLVPVRQRACLLQGATTYS